MKAFETNGEQPDGEVLLSCDENDLASLGIKTLTLRRKIALHLKQANQAASQPVEMASQPAEPQPTEPERADPDTESDHQQGGEEDEATPGPAQPTVATHEIPLSAPTGAPATQRAGTTAGASGSGTVARRMPKHLRDKASRLSQRVEIAPRMTRHRANQVAAFEQAAARMEVQEAVEEEEEEDVVMEEAEEVTETPDDGVRPENSEWDPPARRAMEDMLKRLTADEVNKNNIYMKMYILVIGLINSTCVYYSLKALCILNL